MKSTLPENNAILNYLVPTKRVYKKSFAGIFSSTTSQGFLASKQGPRELFKIALLCFGLIMLSINTAEAQTDTIVCEGETVSLTMTFPSEVRRIQWQVSINNGIDYSDISGATATSYTFIATSNDNNKRFRASYETRECAFWIFCNDWYIPQNLSYTTITANSAPSAPSAENVARCGNGTVTLTASGTTNGNYRWYTAQTGGTAINGERNATYTTPRLTNSTTYYVAVTNGTCESSRIPVTAFVHSGTNTPVVNSVTICSGSTPTISVSSPVNGTVYSWYTASSGGTPFHTGPTYTTPSLTASATYYVAASNACGTSARRTVTVTVNPVPNAPTTTGNSRCGNGTVVLTASGSTNGNYRWYTVATGGTAISRATNASYTTSSLSNTTTYYVAITNGTCESPRTPVTATVNAIPAAPTVTGASRANTGSLTLTASGAPSDGSYRWYTQASGGTAIAGATSAIFVTPELSTTTDYWVAIVSSGNCESSRTRVRASITTVPRNSNLTTHVILYHENFTSYTGGLTATGWNLTPVSDNTTKAAQSSGGTFIRSNVAAAKSLTMDPISTVGYEQIGIMFAHRRSSTTGNALTLQYSLDGTNWMSITNVSSPSTAWSWASNNYIVLPENASNAPNLRIRWQNNSSTASRYYALDDITIIGTPVIGLDRFSWSSRPNGENPFVVSVSNPQAYTVEGLYMKWSRETNVTTTVSGTASGVSHTQFQNTPTLALMQTGANASSNRTIVTLELSRPIEDLTFTLFDIDRESGQFRDDVEIIGYNGNTTVSLTKKQVITSYIQVFSGNKILASDAYNDVATTSKDADVTVTFGSAVDRVVLTYRNASSTGNQGIGIYDLMWRSYDAAIEPLPVELLSFKATAQNNHVTLNWSTASELNNDRFEVERSQDGRTFTKIGTVQGKGTSSLTHHYTFKDTNPGTGTNYYRLRQVDFDGTFEFSKTVATTLRAIAASVKTYPNPFQDYLRVELATEETGSAQVTVIDMQGRVVMEKPIMIEGRYTEFELSTQHLSTGVYFLKIKSANIDSTTKLIKRN
ncbi:T9SS type A sorting domain-containing protein [Pontibacter sp. HSC-14F20]|uniref:Ig-like domain-containing protein n=1 Tax=Pontibacter sp. HSC-14F20 TaxID=2864136 RepID=UPI001C72A7F5|nr:T9SS type A sorting domain-containing protein [Pontibacter sp. HSC-14F20]MBX0335349.1 T9SS type A sorting domain-containing protein [Pontibacter sp. HSC-14F20]